MTLNDIPKCRWGERLHLLYDLQVLPSGARPDSKRDIRGIVCGLLKRGEITKDASGMAVSVTGFEIEKQRVCIACGAPITRHIHRRRGGFPRRWMSTACETLVICMPQYYLSAPLHAKPI